MAPRSFQDMVDEIAARVDGPVRPTFTMRALSDWQALSRDPDGQAEAIRNAFDLNLDDGEASADWPAFEALADLGLRVAPVVREPSFRLAPEKATRDAELGRATIHLAPLWRHPLGASLGQPAEAGTPALILPVTTAPGPVGCVEMLSASDCGGEDGLGRNISDLIAIPLASGRAMSLTGFSVALGAFDADLDKRFFVYGGGKAWLDAFLAPVRSGERFSWPLRPPAGVLAIEPLALEWRVARIDCVIPPSATDVVCPDSRKLAELIDQRMRLKDRVRPFPVVRGPSNKAIEKVAA